MCKKGIASIVSNETGRITNIRVDVESGKSNVICDFTGRGSRTSRIVKISNVEAANKKAAKVMEEKLIELDSKVSKNARSGVKLCPA